MTGDILIVDDMPENLRMLGQILEREGFKVRLAPDGEFALNAAAKRRPDMILMDIRMPGIDGLETSRRLKAMPELRDVPLLFLSASDEPEQRLESFRAGGVDFIPKPFNAEEVLARVSTHLTLARLRAELAAANVKLGAQVVDESARRETAELAAQDSMERLDLALAAAGMGAWEADGATGVLKLDARARAIIGVTTSAPHTLNALVAGYETQDRAPALEAWQAALAGNDIFVIEGWWMMQPTRRRIRLRGERAGQRGISSRFLGLIWDATAEYELTERLVRSERMECLGRMAGGVAHDFNNHLMVIMGASERIRTVTQEDPKLSPWLDNIDRVTETAKILIRDLLLFARRNDAQLQRVDLTKVLERTSALASPLLGTGIKLTCVPAGGEIAILGNLELLLNATLNLCINARDAMPQGGKLMLSVSRQAVDHQRCRISGKTFSGEYSVLTVADTGEGIAPELQNRVLEPFFTTKPEGVGTGLGLATVAGCVQQHKGHLTLDSEVNLGTAFKLYFPVVE